MDNMLSMRNAIFVVVLSLSMSEEVALPALVRVQEEPDGSRLVVLSRGAHRVSLWLNGTDDAALQVLDCAVSKLDDMSKKFVELEHAEMPGDPLAVHYLQSAEVDVAWYGRQCSKIIRNTLREGPQNEAEELLMDRQKAKRALDGTKFCSVRNSRYNPTLEWDVGATDACCQELFRCPSSIMPFHYRFGLLNPYDHRLVDCRCLDDFNDCLAKVEGEKEIQLAREVKRLFFDVTRVKCTTKHSVEMCEEFSTWFDRCESGDTVYVNELIDYQQRRREAKLK